MLGLVVLLIHSMQPPSLGDIANDLPRWCAEQAGVPSTQSFETAEGHRLVQRSEPRRCTLRVEVLDGDDGQIAQGLHDQVVSAQFGWSVIRWRDPELAESGPSLWSHVEHEGGGYLLLIEPPPGQRGEWAVEFSAPE